MSTNIPNADMSATNAPAETEPEPSVPDYMAMEASNRALSASLRPANKADLFAIFAGAGIAKVTVEFDGCGDSGQIESVEAVGTDGKPREMPAISLSIRKAVWGVSEPQCHDMTVTDAIETFAYDLLGDTHPGWEINDGAYGTFVFDVGEGSITLDCNIRFTDAEQFTHSF
ncbi:MAG: DUF6878 family protein [Bosea sp. (in: a-proteobacteria)]